MQIIRTSLLAFSSFAALAAAAPAAAQDEPEALTISGGASLVSDYRFRGISMTNKRPAMQGTISVSHESGLYATVWGSSIDDYVSPNAADVEIDFVGGFKTSLGAATLDVGATYYYYPGPGAASDFVEPYVAISHSFGPVSGKVLAAYAPKQAALSIGDGEEDNFYLAGDLSAAVPGTPISLNAHLGHSWGPSYMTIGDEYTDWSVGASAAYKNLSFGISYVDTNKSLVLPTGRNISKGALVASVGVAF